ncbi:MAG: ATP-binding protein [Oscillospiraceae bacterium]
MQELSLNILDIVQNSIKAKSTLIEISIKKYTDDKTMLISIKDNGCGMTKEQVEQVVDPFYTTRTTRKVGLGVPFFKMSAVMTGGSFFINSEVGKGTIINAHYNYENIDMMPVGDIAATILSLVSVNPDIDFVYLYAIDQQSFTMDTREIKVILEGMPVNSHEVLSFIKDFINENQSEIDYKN